MRLRVKIDGMRWMVGIALLSILVVQSDAPGIRGQVQQPQPPARDDTDAAHPYVAPSASKSVEIGDYYLRRKKFNAALSRFQEAVKTDQHYAPAYQELGKVYERIGLRQKALDAYRRYLEELPSAKDAREAKPAHKAIARLERQLSSGGNAASRQSTRQ